MILIILVLCLQTVVQLSFSQNITENVLSGIREQMKEIGKESDMKKCDALLISAQKYAGY